MNDKPRPDTTLEKLLAIEAIVAAQTIAIAKILQGMPAIRKNILNHIPVAVEQMEGMSYTDAQIAQLIQSLKMFGGQR